jgi:hypothetical protein
VIVSMEWLWRGNAGCVRVLIWVCSELDLPHVFNAVSMVEDRT